MSSHKNYKIVQDPEFGRQIIAARDIQPGEIIIDEPPLVAGPVKNGSSTFTHEDQIEVDICPVCCSLIIGEKSSPNFKCDKCGLNVCSPLCSNDPLHLFNECQVFEKINAISTSVSFLKKKALYNLINVIRCLFHRILSPDVKWAQVLQLESKVKALEKVGAFTDLDSVFKLLKWDFFIDTSTSNSSTTLSSLSKDDIQLAARHCLGVMRTNAFSTFTNTHAREGLYFLSSLMSHSCIMNTDRHQIDHDRMVTRAAVEIKSGEAITTSYLSYLSGTPERFNETRSTWLFTCQCRRCIDPTECGTQISTVACPSCNLLTLQPNLRQVKGSITNDNDLTKTELIWKCTNPKCNLVLENNTVPPALEIVQKSRPPIDKDIYRIEAWLVQYDNGNFLHSNNFLFVQMKFYLCQYYGRNSCGIAGLSITELHKKVKYCLEILQIFYQLFDGIYMFCGTVLFELWCGLNEIKRRTDMNPKLLEDFQTIDFTNKQINQIRTDSLKILQFAMPNSAEESMGLVLKENES